jgi:hypothetical protein
MTTNPDRAHLIAIYLGSSSAVRRTERPPKIFPPVCGVRQPERGAADGAKAGGLFRQKETK